jgi:hypothetical protein
MKTSILFLLMVLIFAACDDQQEKGTLIFKGITSITPQNVVAKPLKVRASGTNHTMHTADLKFYVHEIWASQGLASSGKTDDFKWYKIGSGNALKSVKDYYFEIKDLPVGSYQSIKIIFKNVVERVAVYQKNINQPIIMVACWKW